MSDTDKFVQVVAGPVSASIDVDDNGGITGAGGGFEGGKSNGFGSLGGWGGSTWVSPSAIWEDGRKGLEYIWGWVKKRLQPPVMFG